MLTSSANDPPSLRPARLPCGSSTVRTSSAVAFGRPSALDWSHWTLMVTIAVSFLYRPVPPGTLTLIAWLSEVAPPGISEQSESGSAAGMIWPVHGFEAIVRPLSLGTVTVVDDGVD